jgi:hypothetical protein
MSEKVTLLQEFVEYCVRLSGDEKGEAQVFCDRLFKGLVTQDIRRRAQI